MRNPPNSDERNQGRTKVKRYYSMFTLCDILEIAYSVVKISLLDLPDY